jgi:hypothetical protein
MLEKINLNNKNGLNGFMMGNYCSQLIAVANQMATRQQN